VIEELNFISTTWFTWMASMFWQVSLLIIIIGGIDLLIRNWAWPQIRYALWILVLLKLIIPPSWSFTGSIIPHVRHEIVQEINAAVTVEEETQKKVVEDEDKTIPLQLPSKSGTDLDLNKKNSIKHSQSSTAPSLHWKFYLMGVWIFGIIVFAIVLSMRISKLKKWHAEQEEKKNIPEWFHDVLVKVGKTLSIERLPSIVFSIEALTPAVYGIFRPVLLLPEKYIEDLTEEEAEHVLLHELAHVKRGDLMVHGICLVLQIIYWFNPLLIWSRKQMKQVREICCDMTIANILRVKTKQYRETLVNTARELLTETAEPGMGLLGLFEEPFQLISRLRWLNKETWKTRRLANISTVIISLFFVAFVLPMGELNFKGGDSVTDSNEFSIRDVYMEKVNDLNAELNRAFIDWDLDTIEKFYCDDTILDQAMQPTIEGKTNVMNDLVKQKSLGLEFYKLENIVNDYWIDGKYINVIETYLFKISLLKPEIVLSGSGSSFTIWEIQDDESIKIKYSILNLDNAIPNMKD